MHFPSAYRLPTSVSSFNWNSSYKVYLMLVEYTRNTQKQSSGHGADEEKMCGRSNDERACVAIKPSANGQGNGGAMRRNSFDLAKLNINKIANSSSGRLVNLE